MKLTLDRCDLLANRLLLFLYLSEVYFQLRQFGIAITLHLLLFFDTGL